MDSARFARSGIVWIGATLSVVLLTESGLMSHDTLATMCGGGLFTLLPLYFLAR